MKRVTGVSRRIGSTNWQWAIKTPKDLKSHYSGQWAHRCSLDTADLPAANAKAAHLHIEWYVRFAAIRQVLNPVHLATIASDLRATSGVRIQTLGLIGDPGRKNLSGSDALLLQMVEALTKKETSVSTLAAENQSMPTIKPKTLRDVYDRWAVSGEEKRTIINKNACKSALELFEGFAPDVALDAITRNQGDAFRAWLRDRPGASKTARGKLTYVKSLLKFACQTLEWIPKHPWVGLEIKAATESPRRPWAAAELEKLFSSPVHTAYLLPTHWRAGGAAAYWIPLLGLFTGARMGELCQLRTADVQAIEGIPVLVITDNGEGQQIKSRAGRRTLPLHGELLRLGFLEYVQDMRAAGEDALWPTLRHRLGKPSGYYSEWFSTHRKAQGLTESRPDFHCFRHTVRPLMRRAGFSESTMDKITGHENGGSIGSVVYDHFTLEEIQKAIEAIQYPALVLPVVSPYMAR